MKKIKVHAFGSIDVPIKDLHGIQGDLKEISQEEFQFLEETILKDGICFVSHIWKELKKVGGKKTSQWRVIDGHGRLLIYKSLEKRGYEIPPIPCSEIQGKTFEEAKALVLNANAKFGKIRGDGLRDFLNSLKLKPIVLEKLPLPDINLESFKSQFYGITNDLDRNEAKGAVELDRGSFTKFSQQCPKCGFSFDEKISK